MRDLQVLEQESLRRCAASFAAYEEVSVRNTEKIIHAFGEVKLGDFHFHGTLGYGYNDVGREKLDEVFALVLGAEKAIVRPHFVSGTHALATVLMGLLSSGDHMIAAVGRPYDTMQTVIGLTGNAVGNLQSQGIFYDEVPTIDGTYDLETLCAMIQPRTKLVLIQRSRGYSDRKPLSIDDIEKIIQAIKSMNQDIICFVDNCYGEFTEIKEPCEVGADIIAGSLIKNPGGGIAPTGGYIAGKEKYVLAAANALTAPGLGDEMGSYAFGYRLFFQGLFLAPHVVYQALKGAEFAASLFQLLGFEVFPKVGQMRSDLIQSIVLGDETTLCAFCEGLQSASPVDGYVRPVPGALPGYEDPVIMACGAFVQGSSIELSADAPIRPPYTVYLQGGLIFEHSRLAILQAARAVLSVK